MVEEEDLEEGKCQVMNEIYVDNKHSDEYEGGHSGPADSAKKRKGGVVPKESDLEEVDAVVEADEEDE